MTMTDYAPAGWREAGACALVARARRQGRGKLRRSDRRAAARPVGQSAGRRAMVGRPAVGSAGPGAGTGTRQRAAGRLWPAGGLDRRPGHQGGRAGRRGAEPPVGPAPAPVGRV